MEKVLLRCDCGGLFYSTNQRAIEQHVGHRMRHATGGSFWEWLKLKLGLIR